MKPHNLGLECGEKTNGNAAALIECVLPAGFMHVLDFCDNHTVSLVQSMAGLLSPAVTGVGYGTLDQRRGKTCDLADFEYLHSRFARILAEYRPFLDVAFPGLPSNPIMEIQFNAYNTDCFLKRHLDGDRRSRVLTFVWFFTMNGERNFEGGQLALETAAGKCLVDPQHNSIVFFPLSCWHAVLPVRVPSNRWEDSRMALNGWFRNP